MAFEIKSERIEAEIGKTKMRIKGIIDRLIECKKYLLSDNKICEAMNFSVEGIEQIAKDQLILPMLRALGYDPEYKDNHLEIWSEANIGKYKDGAKTNKRVDYAIFLKEDSSTQPRLIVEAKALAKLDTPRADYESPTQQLQEYYDKRPDAIFLPMLSNGDEYCLFKRSGTDGKSNALGNCNSPFLIYLQDLKDSDEALDLFVRLASRCVINEFTINNATIDDYDNYICQVEAGLKLRKRITDKLLTKRVWSPEEFDDEYGKEEWQYKNVYDRIIIDGDPNNPVNQKIADEICMQIGLPNPNRARRKQVDNIKKWEKDLFERVKTLHSELYYASHDPAPINNTTNNTIDGTNTDATNGTGTGVTNEIGTGATNGTGTSTTDGTNTGTTDGTSSTTMNDPSTNTTGEWENRSKKGVFTQLEMAVLDKVKNICDCENIFAVDNEQYVTFVIANIEQANSYGKDYERNRKNKDDGTYDTPWFMQYGNIIEKSQDDPEHAQNDETMRNTCITLYRHGKSMKDLFSRRDILEDTELEKPAIRLKSISDFDAEDIKDAIKECFDYWYDKWQGKSSN